MKRFVALAALCVTTGFAVPTALADGAFVFNKANGASFCAINVLDSTWTGTSTFVVTPSGNVNFVCNAKLSSGPGVTVRTVYETEDFFTVKLNPDGNAVVTTHRR